MQIQSYETDKWNQYLDVRIISGIVEIQYIIMSKLCSIVFINLSAEFFFLR